MNKSFIIFITLLSLTAGNIFSQTGNAFIENVQVSGSTFSWEFHYERTDAWTSGFFSDALGSSAASFDFNTGALNSPSIVIETGGPLDNANYTVTVQIVGGKCIVDIPFALNALEGALPLNVKVKLLTVSMNITDAAQIAGLSWDGLNTGFFDNADATVTTSLQGSNNAPLPVELNSFTAEAIDFNVKLNWGTATEINNYGFEVERTRLRPSEPDFAEASWETLGFVEGHGNSNSPKQYSYTDKNPIGGSMFIYRLKQIDFDGTYEYSDEIEVEIMPDEFALYQNYPNPFNPTTKIRYQLPRESKVIIKIYDILGAEVITLLNEEKEAGVYEVNFNTQSATHGLPSGTYIYRIIAENFIATKKMVLLK